MNTFAATSNASSTAATAAIDTAVFKCHPQFNALHQKTTYSLIKTDEAITQGLAKRLVKYATERMEEEGFNKAIAGWDVIVETADADQPAADRSYIVSWKNPKGAQLKIVGILTQRGWPTLDHGLEVERA